MSEEGDDATVVEGQSRPDAAPPIGPDGDLSDLSDTVHVKPRLAGRASSSSSSSSSSSTSPPTDSWRTLPGVLSSEGAARGRALARLAAVVSGATLIAIWLPRETSVAQWIASVALTTVVLASVGLSLWYRDEKRFNQKLELAHGIACVLAIFAVCVYLGVYSPAVMALCLGIYYFGLSDWTFAGWFMYATCALGYLALCVLAALGVVDIGGALLALKPISPGLLLAFGLVCQVILGATFWLARESRRATHRAFTRLQRAAQQINKRDALLDEAQADLDRAMRARIGAYTHTRVDEYDVADVVGRGAMGEVYRATHASTGAPAALKFLQHVATDDPNNVKRFFREAEIVSSLDSPHIVRVLGSGFTIEGAPYIAMELLEGEDLASKLRRKGKLGVSATLELIEEVSRALAVADASGIVHRDLKPQNLFQVESGGRRTWKVLDFGVSKVMASSGTLTQGAAVGTPSYMSPEQAKGADVDHRADVFAVGVIAYRCLTGRPAFTGPDMVSTLYNVLHVQPTRPSDLVRVPEDVERVLALAMAKRRERRLGSTSMFAAALQDAAKQRLDARLRQDADSLLHTHPWGIDDEDQPRAKAD